MGLILIVDDSALARRAGKMVAEKLGHETVEAANGREGLELALERQPDCILLDLLMPELDGFGVLEQLREKETNIPVIVSTADIQDSTRDRCEQLGAFAILNKPPNADKLHEALQKALENRQEAAS